MRPETAAKPKNPSLRIGEILHRYTKENWNRNNGSVASFERRLKGFAVENCDEWFPAGRMLSTIDSCRRAIESFNVAGLTLVLTELSLAVTFCGFYLLADSPVEATHEAENAEVALQIALRTRKQLRLNNGQQKEVMHKISELRSFLNQLKKVPARSAIRCRVV